jgi:hypothetical protein
MPNKDRGQKSISHTQAAKNKNIMELEMQQKLNRN